MPKLPSKLKQKLAAKDTGSSKCIACRGTGKSSNGGRCFPCNGSGKPYTWSCPKCGAKHHGFKRNICKNEKCKMFGKEQ